MRPARHQEPSLPSVDPASISNYEAKFRVAEAVAAEARPGQVIGAGSGSTALLAIRAIAARARRGELDGLRLVPTSIEVHLMIVELGLESADLEARAPDWLFDGADEADPAGDLIKGRGGALFREKLLFTATADRRVLIDPSKRVEQLGARFPVPVEVVPRALPSVLPALRELGAAEAVIRTGVGKDGPVITESGNVLVDCRFERIEPGLEEEIKLVTGVLESGLFQGYEPRVITA